MAIILAVDDHTHDRELLVTLLGYYGHRMLEAADGTEALEMARVERPNLIISDILMPTMDGYEFVWQLRTDPSIANTAFFFYTTNYRQREGLAIAQACGVSHLLVKPCDPADILRTVATVLHDFMPNIPPLPPETMWRWQTSLPSEQPTHRRLSKIMMADLRLMALIEFWQQLASEHHPQRLLEGFCKAARDLIGARLAILRRMRRLPWLSPQKAPWPIKTPCCTGTAGIHRGIGTGGEGAEAGGSGLAGNGGVPR